MPYNKRGQRIESYNKSKKGSHTMPDGSSMKNSEMSNGLRMFKPKSKKTSTGGGTIGSGSAGGGS